MATSQGTWESNTGLGVQSHYGARGTDDAGGQIKTSGTMQEVKLVIDGTMVSNGALPLARATLPAGCRPIRATVAVSEAFALGGTSPVIDIGTQGSEATNGFEALDETNAEAAGSYIVTTFSGTWAAELAAETTIDVAMGGTSPTSTSAGKATVVIEYMKQD